MQSLTVQKVHFAVSLIRHCFAVVGITLLPNLLYLQFEGITLHTSVIPTIIFLAHTADQTMLCEQFSMLSAGILGVLNRSSQHWVVDWISDIYSKPRLVSSSRVFFGTWYAANCRWRGSRGSTIETGRNPWGSIAVESHSCSRSCRAAMGCGGRQRRFLPRTQS